MPDTRAAPSEGRARGRETRDAWWRRPAVWLAALVGASAAIAIAVVIPRQPATLTSPDTAIRSGEIGASAPAGPIAAVGEFAWTSPYTKASYRVTVVNAAGAIVYTTFTSQEHVTMPRNQAARLAPGRYSWKVEAFDVLGRGVATSRTQSFEITPQR